MNTASGLWRSHRGNRCGVWRWDKAVKMERCVYILVAWLWLTPSATAQKPEASAPIEADPILAAMKADGCKRLGALGDLVDGENRAEIAATIAADPGDSTWDTLIGCYEGTRKPSERLEALRVAAQWEQLRAYAFQESYNKMAVAAQPVSAPACKALDKLDAQTKAMMPTKETIDDASYQRPDNFGEILGPLLACSTESKKLNAGKPVPEYVQADKDLAMLSHADHVANENRLWVAANGGAAPNTNQGSTRGEPVDSGTSSPVTINAGLCDQVITVAGLTPNGLALYIPPEGQKFMAKNAKDYPRMCLLQDASRFIPGVRRYLLVWAYSQNAFAGFQPVQQVTTSPVSGSGTVTNLYGDRWNFTYSGTLTEIDTVEAPYVIQSRSLYLRAYDEKGNMISQHSVTTSNQTGGDASYAAGYNAAALISLLWNNPSHLIKSVLRDVQKDSMKYGKK